MMQSAPYRKNVEKLLVVASCSKARRKERKLSQTPSYFQVSPENTGCHQLIVLNLPLVDALVTTIIAWTLHTIEVVELVVTKVGGVEWLSSVCKASSRVIVLVVGTV